MIKFRDNFSRTMLYFTDSPLNVGDVVAFKNTDSNIVRPIHLAESKVPLGLSQYSVIDIDKNKVPVGCQCLVGCKISILGHATLVISFDKSLSLPIYQPIYVDVSTSQLTWKFLGPKVGYTTERQAQDGSVSVVVNFN